MNLYELCREAAIPVSDEARAVDVGGIKTDSRRVERGDLFLCIRGLTFNGHEYIKDAVERGAVGVVVDRSYKGDLPQSAVGITVKDTRHAAAMLYDAWYGHPSRSMKIVAVTGTNGKTSVTHMLRAIFEGAMHKCGLVGTVDCYSAGKRLNVRSENPLANMTTPDPEELYRMLAIMAADGVEYVFMEATSHALALSKLDALCFEAAVFTNMTPEHLDFHGDMEKYFSAKSRLFSMCKRAILNVDDAYGRRLSEEITCPTYTCSTTRRDVDFFATDIKDRGVDGSEYILNSRNHRVTLRTPIPGAFNVINTMEAATCATVLGISPAVITQALGALSGIAGRMERIRLGTLTDYSVFIDYAHTPDALENLLMTARGIKQADQRIVLVFGCGGDRDKSKRPIMGTIAARLADVCVVTSDNSRSEDPMDIIRDITASMRSEEYTVIPNREEAITHVIRHARRGDIILLAGKGHEEYEIDREGKHPFCEKEIAKAAALRYQHMTPREQQREEKDE